EGALAELVVVVVDLPGALRGHDHQRVARVHVLEQVVDARMDHGRDMVPAGARRPRTSSVSSPTARSRSSFSTTKSNSSDCLSCSRASAIRSPISRVVADTVTSSTGTRSSSSRISVPLPAPDGPVTTTTDGRRRRLTVEEANQLRALPLRQAADRLRLADPARAEEARSFHAPELR